MHNPKETNDKIKTKEYTFSAISCGDIEESTESMF